MPKTEYLLIFCILLYMMTVFGSGTAMFGLAIGGFMENLDATIAQVSYGLTISFILGIFASLIASYTLDKYNRQLQFSFTFTILAITYIVMPWIKSYTVYLVVVGISGSMLAFVGVVPNVWVMEMFGSVSKIYLQILHTFYPLGQIFSPIIYVPIVGSDNYANLWIPYLLIGLLMISVSVMILIAYFIKPYRNPKSETDSMNTEQEIDGLIEDRKNITFRYKIIFISAISIVGAIQLTNEFNGVTYISTYLQKSDRHLSEVDAAYCQAILSTATTIGRVLNIFLTFKIRPHTMLFINFVFMTLGNSIIMIMNSYNSESLLGIHVGVSLLGYGFSNAWPMLLAFVDERVGLSNQVMSLINFTGSTFLAINPSVLGQILDTHPNYYAIANLSLSSFAFLIYIMLIILEAFRSVRKTQKNFGDLFDTNLSLRKDTSSNIN